MLLNHDLDEDDLRTMRWLLSEVRDVVRGQWRVGAGSPCTAETAEDGLQIKEKEARVMVVILVKTFRKQEVVCAG